MIDILAECPRLLAEAGICSVPVQSGHSALVFEGATVLGFVLVYPDPEALIAGWKSDGDALVSAFQFGLRRAQTKAWNTYLILLAERSTTYSERVALSAIEEDLSGTRKIARGGVTDIDNLRQALLPLLPIQSAPRLGAVDMKDEIRLRTTSLPERAVEAFFSQAPVSAVAQALEEMP